MTLNYDSMYEQVQAQIAKQDAKKNNNANYTPAYREVLKLEVGGEYIFRIIPYAKDGVENIFDSTFFRYIQYNWQHLVTDASGKTKNKWEFVISPRTFGEACPIAEFSNNYRRSATKEQQENLKKMLGYREGHLINVLVIKDTINSENEGKVKILDCPKTIWNTIDATLRGDLDEEWSENLGTEVKLGKKVINLTDEGMNLLIKVTPDEKRKTLKGNPMPNYSTCRWQLKGAKLGLSADAQKELVLKSYDLAKVNRVLPVDDIRTLFNTTFLPKLGIEAPAEAPKTEKKVVTEKKTSVDDDDVTEPINDEPPVFRTSAPDKVDTVGDVDDFLNGLDL